MARSFQDKRALVERWAPAFARAEAVIVFRHFAIYGQKETELRRALDRGGAGRYLVLANTLSERILDGGRLAPVTTLLQGPTSFLLVFEGAPGALKALFAYLDGDFLKVIQRESRDKQQGRSWIYKGTKGSGCSLIVKGGFVDGELMDEEALRRVAALPSRDELRSRLLATMAALLTSALATFEAPARAWLGLLSARAATEG